MKRILLVDDDATILEIYRKRFLHEGFEVETAADGLAATRTLQATRPDLVVLDLMMPKLSGVDVLKFIRSQPELGSTPVAIFTNSFMNDLADAASGLGVQRAILKTQCTPDALVAIANEIFTGASPPAVPAARAVQSGRAKSPSDSTAEVRQHFLTHMPDTLAAVRKLHEEFAQCAESPARLLRLDNLCRKVHFITALAGMAACHRIALLCGAFEALLYELEARPAHIDASTLNTVAVTVDFLEVLFDTAREVSSEESLEARVLVVDDDPLSNHLVVAALRRAQLDAEASDNPLSGLELLRQRQYDLVLLDIEMPNMTGFDLCRKLRTLTGYARTPVIYVTAHTDFENRARSVLAGGNDLIAKPIFPIELAVKVVTHLLKSRLPATAAGL